MSKRQPHDVKFKFKSIECAKKITKEVANNIVLFLNKISAGHSLLSPEVLSNKVCKNRLVHVVLSNDAFLFKSAQRSISSHFSIVISFT